MRKLTLCLFTLILTLCMSPTSMAKNPYAMPDESWISISGTVVAPGADTFTLDYGEGVITVEMDDWDWYGEANQLLDGDRVTVYGEVDDGLYEIASIEASSVYVQNLNTYFYASDADEEDSLFAVSVPIDQTTVQGTVTSVNGREFTIDTEAQTLTVDCGYPHNGLQPVGQEGVSEDRKGRCCARVW